MGYKFMISGGGTGGHIYPAIAIADTLKEQFPEAKFLFVGARDRMEMDLVPRAGYQIEGLWISGIQRKLSFKNLLLPFKIFSSLFKSYRLIRSFQPDFIIGTGGFASGPLLFMASFFSIPYLIQEQNAFAGLTNKWLAKKSVAVCVAYPNMERFFKGANVQLTGNPVRLVLTQLHFSREEACETFGFNAEDKIVLLLGGSLGSAQMNRWMSEQLSYLIDQGFKILWQCGRSYFETYEIYESSSVRVLPYIMNMGAAYAAADMIISRAGAGAISELALVGKPTLFIPSPVVAEDHQTQNARSMVALGAALMLKEDEMEERSSEVLGLLIARTLSGDTTMAEAFRNQARPEASKTIVNLISEYLR